jgi:hypothetical protein
MYVEFLPGIITKLQTRGLSLSTQLQFVQQVRSTIQGIPGVRGSILQHKSDTFSKNSGLTILRELHLALTEGVPLLSTIA